MASNEVKALVIRLRLYIANYALGENMTGMSRYAFAGKVLGISASRAYHIFFDNIHIAKMSKQEVIKTLKEKDFTFYIVATCDITYDKYISIVGSDNDDI